MKHISYRNPKSTRQDAKKYVTFPEEEKREDKRREDKETKAREGGGKTSKRGRQTENSVKEAAREDVREERERKLENEREKNQGEIYVLLHFCYFN